MLCASFCRWCCLSCSCCSRLLVWLLQLLPSCPRANSSPPGGCRRCGPPPASNQTSALLRFPLRLVWHWCLMLPAMISNCVLKLSTSRTAGAQDSFAMHCTAAKGKAFWSIGNDMVHLFESNQEPCQRTLQAGVHSEHPRNHLKKDLSERNKATAQGKPLH